MTRYSFILLVSLFLLFGLVLIAYSQTTDPEMQAIDNLPEEISTLVQASSDQVKQGASLYNLHCAACHGNTGTGLEEARLAFPEDHRDCESCHKPRNPKLAAQIPDIELNERNCFALGTPPALQGSHSLSTFTNAQVLFGYIQATMPRWQPNNLSQDEYLAVTAFLLELNNVLPEGVDLNPENLLTVRLGL